MNVAFTQPAYIYSIIINGTKSINIRTYKYVYYNKFIGLAEIKINNLCFTLRNSKNDVHMNKVITEPKPGHKINKTVVGFSSGKEILVYSINFNLKSSCDYYISQTQLKYKGCFLNMKQKLA